MRKFIVTLFILSIVLCSGCSSSTLDNVSKEVSDQVSNIKDADNKYVKMVKGGYRTDNPDITYEKAFGAFFSTPTWKYIKAETGEDVVEFTGGCIYQDADVKARLQFIVDEENGTFEARALAFNEVPQNRLITMTLIEKAFSEYEDSVPSTEKSAKEPQAPQSGSSVDFKEIWINYIFMEIPTSWDYSYNDDGSYIVSHIYCPNDKIEMDVFESRNLTEDVRNFTLDDGYTVKSYTFAYGENGKVATDGSKILFTYDNEEYTFHFLVDYSADPKWYAQNKELINTIAGTIGTQH